MADLPYVSPEMTLQMVAAATRQAARTGQSPVNPTHNCYEFEKYYRPVMEGAAPAFHRFTHLREPYEDTSHDQVYMAGAQGGKTRRLMAEVARNTLVRWGAMIACFYPDGTTRKDNSLRFEEYIKSVPKIRALLGAGIDGRTGQDGIERRTVGASSVLFRLIGGRSSTESIPVQVLVFDELRRMRPSLVALAEKRVDGQEDPIIFKASTASFPDQDIHAAFKVGDQRFFHTECKCPDGVVLSLNFPDCVVDLKGATPELQRKVEHACTLAGVPYCGVEEADLKRYGAGILMCPKCGMFILRPREGWWERHNPEANVHSWQFSQMHSPILTGPRLAQKVHRPNAGIIDMGGLFRDVAGMPYIATDDRPLSRDHLMGMVRPELPWPANYTLEWRRANVSNTAMGIDHMKGYNLVWIKQWAPNGKARTVHLEVCHGGNPWVRCGALMDEYDVACCVLEEGPNYNEALRFADVPEFRGRVWLLHYSNNKAAHLAKWQRPQKSIKGQEISTTRYMVVANQDRLMQWSIGLWKRREQEIPNPRGLIQRLPRKDGRAWFSPELRDGVWEPCFVGEDIIFPHLEAVAFTKHYRDGAEESDVGARFDLEYQPIGMDPHAALAGAMADLALSQISGVSVEDDFAGKGVSENGEHALTGMTDEEILAKLMEQEPDDV